MKKNNINAIIIILLAIFCIMLYLIFSNYINNKRDDTDETYNYSKDWKVYKYDNYYELYVKDQGKENGSNIYLLDKDNNLICLLTGYNSNTNIYVSYYDISSTQKVIISKEKIKYNKDISKKVKYIGPTTITHTTTTRTIERIIENSQKKILGD